MLGFVVLCGSALIIGHAEPLPNLVPGLQVCDGTLCYQGIVAGETSTRQARSLMATSELPIETKGNQDGYSSYSGMDNKRFLVLYDYQHEVGFLMLDLEQAPIQLGNLNNKYGLPCAIELEAAPIVVLEYPHFRAAISLSDTRLPLRGTFTLRPDTAITQIYFTGRQGGCAPTDYNNYYLHWRGFKTWEYLYERPDLNPMLR
ncbi:MAG TPA: hypothetical protein VMT34_10280 [Aggregatilineales bacterium]|nr:hypothetical protein [Aggregatilineales bacterium]